MVLRLEKRFENEFGETWKEKVKESIEEHGFYGGMSACNVYSTISWEKLVAEHFPKLLHKQPLTQELGIPAYEVYYNTYQRTLLHKLEQVRQQMDKIKAEKEAVIQENEKLREQLRSYQHRDHESDAPAIMLVNKILQEAAT